MNEETRKKFFTETEHSGRHVVYSFRTGKRYYIEPIDGNKVNWGDLNPATGELEGSYGQKYKGSVKKSESLITEENGFMNIALLPPGQSPAAEIERRDAQYPTIQR
jgi:hypothetical protein